MVNFNLLPEEQRVSRGLYDTLRLTKSLGVIALALFLIFLISSIAYFIFASSQLKALDRDNEVLVSEARNYEVSEQQMVLLKDRIAKIGTILAYENSQENLRNTEAILANIGGNTIISEISVTPKGLSMSMNFLSNSEVTNFFNSLSGFSQFTQVGMENLGLSPTNGYLGIFNFETKK